MPRWVRIVCGYLAASLVVALVLSAPATLDPLSGVGLWPRVAAAAIMFCIVAVIAVPSIIGVVLAEDKGERRFLYYAICGAIVGALPIVFIGLSTLGSSSPNALHSVPFFSVLGLIAGSVYWLIAGRKAGQRTPAIDV